MWWNFIMDFIVVSEVMGVPPVLIHFSGICHDKASSYWAILVGFAMIKHLFLGNPILGNLHVDGMWWIFMWFHMLKRKGSIGFSTGWFLPINFPEVSYKIFPAMNRMIKIRNIAHNPWRIRMLLMVDWCDNMTGGFCWWWPCYHSYTIRLDPSWALLATLQWHGMALAWEISFVASSRKFVRLEIYPWRNAPRTATIIWWVANWLWMQSIPCLSHSLQRMAPAAQWLSSLYSPSNPVQPMEKCAFFWISSLQWSPHGDPHGTTFKGL